DPVASITCCPAFAGDQFVGLALRPGKATTAGPGCSTCVNCTIPMVHSLAGDSTLGNGSFALRLTRVPAGRPLFAVLQPRPTHDCAPAGVSLPSLCGPLLLSPAPAPSPLTLGPISAPAGPGCVSAPQQFPLALPPTPALAGLPLASQCAGFCSGGGSALS